MRVVAGGMFCLLAIGLLCSTGAAAPGDGASLPAPIMTRQNSFSIPYTVPITQNLNEQIQEIRLFVSADGAKSWQVADAVKLASQPESRKGEFVFRAPRDGEYLFAIRTVDRQGQLRGGKQGPELRVIVDSEPPKLQASAERGAAGEIQVRWELADPFLVAESLSLQYQYLGDTEWRDVAFDRPRTTGTASPARGLTTFWTQGQPGVELLIRAEVKDRAGNLAATQLRLNGAGGGTTPAATVTSNTNTPAVTATNSKSNASPAAQLASSSTSLAAQSPIAANSPAVLPSTAPTSGSNVLAPFAEPSIPASASAGSTGKTANGMRLAPAETSGPLLLGPGSEPPAFLSSNTLGNIPPSTAANIKQVPGPQWSTPPAAPSANALPTAAAKPPLVTTGSAQQPTTGLATLPSTGNPLVSPQPAAANPVPLVNAKVFEWDYELDQVGVAGIARVELWMTRDNGKTWTSVGVDPDNRTPIRTSVTEEGTYGYRITVQSAGGPQPRPPQPNDPPEMVIGVDLTPPAVKLLNAEIGTGGATGEVAITWQAGDSYLASRPVSLWWASTANGPWTTIAAGLENTGRYTWRYDLQTPDQIYLKLEVRDAAGNVGVSASTAPISLEKANPKGHLREVRPIREGTESSTARVPLEISLGESARPIPPATNSPLSKWSSETPLFNPAAVQSVANPFVPPAASGTVRR